MRFTQAALQHFQLSLEVTRRIAEKSGRHLLVSPLALTANALASLRRFAEAFDLYEQAIALNADHYGTSHSSNVALLVDYGISLVHAGLGAEQAEQAGQGAGVEGQEQGQGRCSTVTRVLGRALRLLEGEMEAEGAVPRSSHVYRRASEYQQKAALYCD